MRSPRAALWLLLSGIFICNSRTLAAQVIEFENAGLRFQSMTQNGVTLMCARLPVQLKQFALIQVALSNGSEAYATLKPEDFAFNGSNGETIRAMSARDVVTNILEHGTHGDLVKLVKTYENAIYAIPNLNLKTGYEKRRQAALGEGTNTKFKAAAAASAIALIASRVAPGQTIDGAVFFPIVGGALPAGRVTARPGTVTYEFNPE